jgi:hypothetical protein
MFLLFIYLFIYFDFAVLEFELRASLWVGRSSST